MKELHKKGNERTHGRMVRRSAPARLVQMKAYRRQNQLKEIGDLAMSLQSDFTYCHSLAKSLNQKICSLETESRPLLEPVIELKWVLIKLSL
jgi:hypothetical protein